MHAPGQTPPQVNSRRLCNNGLPALPPFACWGSWPSVTVFKPVPHCCAQCPWWHHTDELCWAELQKCETIRLFWTFMIHCNIVIALVNQCFWLCWQLLYTAYINIFLFSCFLYSAALLYIEMLKCTFWSKYCLKTRKQTFNKKKRTRKRIVQ